MTLLQINGCFPVLQSGWPEGGGEGDGFTTHCWLG